MNRPFEAVHEQAAGFEDSLRRFFTACDGLVNGPR
jgi:hypothetical protein